MYAARTLVAVTFALCVALPLCADDWPGWRGPMQNGHTAEKGFPVRWDEKSVVWKTPLKGQGQSSPIVCGERIFLTSALDKGKERLVLCLDRRTGKVLWEQVAWKGTPELSHVMNGWASSTCVTDGARVYAAFGKGGIHCYTVEGKHVWSKDLGTFFSKTKRGTAASPILVGDLVVWNGDSETDPWLFALDKLTGDIRWKSKRSGKEGYSTPIVVQANGRQEIVLNGDPYLVAYDPADGKELYRCKNFAPRGEPTVTFAHGLIYVVNGQPGDIYALRPGGSGDVTASQMAWHTPRRVGRDQPSPIVVGDYLFAANMEGMLLCYDAKSGKELWKERITQGKITAAPVSADGRLYLLDEAGETVVLEPGPQFKLLSRNTLNPGAGEIFRATPTPVGGQFLLRSDRTLYCVGK